MNAMQRDLYERLMAFQIDAPGVGLTFARRLARENGWSLAYAERVIVEYKRFLLLASEAGHVVSPSEQVDQAWHLHLTYTRSYWDGLCRDLLGRPLHHGPTKGGAAEQAKFIDLYNQTLASYERIFGEPPPGDIWSPADKRFGEDLRHVSVNTERYWIVPKPRWLRLQTWLQGQTPLFVAGLIGLPLAAATWNPLDWKGPDFLGFYLLVAILAAVAALVVRVAFAPGETEFAKKKSKPLDAYEAACLAAGPVRTVQAAFAAMVQAGTLKLGERETTNWGIFTRTTTTIEQGAAPPASAPALERAMFAAALAPPTENLTPLVAAGLPYAKEIEEDLKKRGLVHSFELKANCVLAGLIMASPLVLGIAKIIVGASRGRPVGFLVAACVVTAIAAALFAFAHSRLTERGKALLESLQKEHAKTEAVAKTSVAILSPMELAMAVSLFGFGMLAGGPLANVHAMLPRATGGGGCSSGGGGCGGGGCGGGGCGGGGCGGGCGGCGG
jgi:uncharacterized protein (TIGR04222 family)